MSNVYPFMISSSKSLHLLRLIRSTVRLETLFISLVIYFVYFLSILFLLLYSYPLPINPTRYLLLKLPLCIFIFLHASRLILAVIRDRTQVLPPEEEHVLVIIQGDKSELEVELIKKYTERGAKVKVLVKKGEGFQILRGVEILTCELTSIQKLKDLVKGFEWEKLDTLIFSSNFSLDPKPFTHDTSLVNGPPTIFTLPLPSPSGPSNARPSTLAATTALFFPLLMGSKSPAIYLITETKSKLNFPGFTSSSCTQAAEVQFLETLRLETRSLKILDHGLKDPKDLNSIFDKIEIAIVPEHRQVELRVGIVLMDRQFEEIQKSLDRKNLENDKSQDEEKKKKKNDDFSKFQINRANLIISSIDFGEREVWISGKWYWINVIKTLGGPAAAETIARVGGWKI